MTRLVTAETSAVNPATLAAARALLVDAFEGEFSAEDWEHTVGGVHALLWEGRDLIGHASVVPRRLRCGRRALRAGYVESVGIRADRRRRGHGSALMDAVEHVLRREYDLGALGASDQGRTFYAARGWRLWRGPLSALTATGVQRLPAGHVSVYVFAHAVSLDVHGELMCEWREGALW